MFDLTIVIPTKDRAAYAASTVESCCKLGGSCEVVVVDSSANSELESVLRSRGLFERITYVKSDCSFSVVDNFNYACQFIRGRYACFIGDDDLVTESVFAVVRFAESKKIQCVRFKYPATYWWPDFRHRRRGTIDAATVQVRRFRPSIRGINSQFELERAAAVLGSGPQGMLRAYAGLVSTELLNSITRKYGQVFGGVSPDVYSSVLLSRECEVGVEIDFPVIVPGVSGASTSGASSDGRHLGGLRENPHIAPFRQLVWDGRVPEFYAVPTVWGYSMLKALEKISFDTRANLFSMYLKCFLYCRGYRRETWKSFSRAARDQGMLLASCQVLKALHWEGRYIFDAVWKRASGVIFKHKTTTYRNVETSFEARQLIDREFDVRTLSRVLDESKWPS